MTHSFSWRYENKEKSPFSVIHWATERARKRTDGTSLNWTDGSVSFDIRQSLTLCMSWFKSLDLYDIAIANPFSIINNFGAYSFRMVNARTLKPLIKKIIYFSECQKRVFFFLIWFISCIHFHRFHSRERENRIFHVSCKFDIQSNWVFAIKFTQKNIWLLISTYSSTWSFFADGFSVSFFWRAEPRFFPFIKQKKLLISAWDSVFVHLFLNGFVIIFVANLSILCFCLNEINRIAQRSSKIEIERKSKRGQWKHFSDPNLFRFLRCVDDKLNDFFSRCVVRVWVVHPSSIEQRRFGRRLMRRKTHA